MSLQSRPDRHDQGAGQGLWGSLCSGKHFARLGRNRTPVTNMAYAGGKVRWMEQVALPKRLMPEDVARLALFLATSDANAVTVKVYN